MQNKKNLFAEKFRLLNSQEYNEEINWASSSSSDYELITHKSTARHEADYTRNRKRKRKKNFKSLHSLDVNVIDVIKDSRRHDCVNKSPILCNKNRSSPILRQRMTQQSPILVSRNIQRKSPILSPKVLPKHYVKVKKQLFNTNYNYENTYSQESIHLNNSKINSSNNRQLDMDYIRKSCQKESTDVLHSLQNLQPKVTYVKNTKKAEENSTCSEVLDIDNAKKVKEDLIKKVKLFFNSHFSSEELSQNTISESQTSSKSSNKSEDVEIYASRTQFDCDNTNQRCSKEKTLTSSESSTYELEKAKKVRYKKDGLAYRLNNILKKRKAHISLWQHERYLAVNSNFVIPKQEHAVFCIREVYFKYGCYLLDAFDVSDQFYYIVINAEYVNENIKNECVIKLYKPYQFVNFNDKCKLVINVCKFQIVDINK